MLGLLPFSCAATAAGRHKPGRPERRLPAGVIVIICLALGLLVLYPGLILRGEVFVSADARNADAFDIVGDEALSDGHYPLWNPYLFAGMPTFGSLAYTPFLYPPSIVLNFCQTTLKFPPTTWLICHLLFGGLGMAYLLSRWRLPTAALVMGALIWILLPKVTAWAVYGHGSKLGAAMYMPWIVACAWNVLKGRGAKAMAFTALLMGLQILRGHIQMTFYTLLSLGWLALFSVLPWTALAAEVTAAVRWRRVAALALAIGVGFLIGSILLVPVHEYAGRSIRGLAESGGGADYNYATAWSLSAAELPTLLFPSYAGFGKATYMGQMPISDYPNYFGWLMLLLAASAWWSGRKRQLFVWAVLFGFSILVALGRHSPLLYDVLYRHLPYFNKFRVPSMIMILPGLVLAVLAARGAAVLATGRGAGRWWPRSFIWLVAGIGLLLLLLGGSGLIEQAYATHLTRLAESAQKPAPPFLVAAAWDMHRADLIRIGLILMVAAVAMFTAQRKPAFGGRGLIWTLALLIAVDLLAVDRRITHPEGSLKQLMRDTSGRMQVVAASRLLRPYVPARKGMGQGPTFTALAQSVGHERVWPLGSLADYNDAMVAGVRSLGGYHPAKLAAYEKVRSRLFDQRAPAARLASWLAARIVAVPGELGGETLEALRRLGVDLTPEPLHRGDMVLYENRSALPRARWASSFVLEESLPGGGDLEHFLDDVQNGRWQIGDRVVLDHPPAVPLEPAAQPLPAPEYLVDGLDEVALRTSAPSASLLVLADMTAPGWRVTVDDQPAELLRADFILRAVAVPAGRHEVRFHYLDPAMMRGLLMSLVGLLCVVILFAAHAVIQRRGGWGKQRSGSDKTSGEGSSRHG